MIELSQQDKEHIFEKASERVIEKAMYLHVEYHGSIKAVELMSGMTGISPEEYKTWLDNELERLNKEWDEDFKRGTRLIDLMYGVKK